MPAWGWLLLALAAVQVVAALAGVATGGLWSDGSAAAPAIPLWIDLVHILLYGAAAIWLIVGGQRDVRAVALGGVFLFIAAVFSSRLLFTLAATLGGAVGNVLAFLGEVNASAFVPFFLWAFAARFPHVRPFGRGARFGRAMTGIALACALVLAAASLAAAYRPELASASPVGWLALQGSGVYWPTLSLLILGALAFLTWRSRQAEGAERRRARLFLAALVLGIGPLFVDVLLESLVPPFGRLMNRPASRLVGGAILYPLLLSIPVTTTYAVLVHRVLDVRLVVRKALRYALARYSVVALATVPFAALIGYVYARRSEPITEILTGTGALVLLGLSLAGAAALRLRVPILGAIDRRFFRERYDAQRILAELAGLVRKAPDPGAWAEMLTSEIDRALHLHSHAVLLLDAPAGTYRAVGAGGIREIPVDAPLVRQAVAAGAPLLVDLAAGSATVASLPEEDRQWLAGAGFEVLVPVVGSSGDAIALVALGEKKSELPFTAEDLSWLGTLAVAAAGPLDLLARGASGGLGATIDDSETDAPARECPVCWTVHPAASDACPECGRPLIAARVPTILAGKFHLVRRLGAGGMGVVYQGWDRSLDRPVAVKTLPALDAERAMRMRREARAMAAVAHPNLAAIYAVESWRGTPLLILELLEGGTLAERLATEPLAPGELIALGVELADALAQLHGRGILHRDIKPSNIGFTATGTAKLLDFGLARLVAGSRGRSPRRVRVRPAPRADESVTASYDGANDGSLEGTPRYMSPEARSGHLPSPAFDLWSLAVVLWEALIGQRAFPSHDPRGEEDERYRLDLAAVPPDAPPRLVALLERSLSPNRRQRPSSAKDFAARLRALR